MGIQINGNTDNISATDGGLTVSDLELNQTGVSTFHSHLHVADQIIHLDDANSKIRFPAADTITAETAGSERLRITSTGYLKVTNGSTSDFNTIQRASTSNYSGIRIQDADATQRMQIGVAGGTNNIATGAAQHDVVLKSYANLLLATNQTERLRIDSSGRLLVGGTGNTESDIRLYLHNPSAAGSQIQITGNGSGTGNSLSLIHI